MSNKYGIFEMKNTACEKNVFQGMVPTLKGCKLVQRMFHLKRHIFWKGYVFVNQVYFFKKNACPARSCYSFGRKASLFEVKLHFFEMQCILQLFFKVLLPARRTVLYEMGMSSLIVWIYFCMSIWKQRTDTTSSKWIVIANYWKEMHFLYFNEHVCLKNLLLSRFFLKRKMFLLTIL